MPETLIKVDNISKKFCRSLKRSLWYGARDLGNELIGRRHGSKGDLRTDEFWAVDGVSFEIKRGECLGLIGRNGAGKTTLLRMLNGLIKPDNGRIEMHGRVSALISLGAGFSPVLTGRENVHVNASVLGLTNQETKAKLQEIIEFAEIGEFIDMPVQSYSTGMTVRLGFAVASSLDPDVLLLDEVLAVGDASFKFKCYRRIDELLKKAAVIFVTHDMPQLTRVCDRVILLNHGQTVFDGASVQGIDAYHTINATSSLERDKLLRLYSPINNFVVSQLPDEIEYRSPFRIGISVSSDSQIRSITLRIDVRNQGGGFAASCLVSSVDFNREIKKGTNCWEVEISSLPLKPGKYSLSMNLANESGALIAVWDNGHNFWINGGQNGIAPDCQLNLSRWSEI